MLGIFKVKSFLFFFAFVATASASPGEICIYISDEGRPVRVNSRLNVPPRFKEQAKCFRGDGSRNNYLANPEDVTLKGLVREEDMGSSVGRIKLRWPRSVELLFGRTPARAMADAAQTVSRAVKQGGFPSSLQNLNLDWSVVFIDGEMRGTEIPQYLIASCHPGWMVPPANIYIVAQRVAKGCAGGPSSSAKVADSQLAQVLIHEMGHALEFKLLGGKGGLDHGRAEGFATWFEQYAAEFSTIIPRGQISGFHLASARQAFVQNRGYFQFSGSAEDYSLASMIFRAIVNRRGVRGLMEVYDTMLTDNLSFPQAVKRRLGWDEKDWDKELSRILS